MRKLMKRTTVIILSLFMSSHLIVPNAKNEMTEDPVQSSIVLADEIDESTAEPLKYKEIPVEKFRIENLSPEIETSMDYTDWWYSEWDDCRYLFLPITADRDQLIITYTAEDSLYLNETLITSGEMTSLLGTADEFLITVGDTECGTLKIMQSNLGCIYLSTKSGGLDALDNENNLEETGSALMLNADGGTEYDGEIEKLTSHGNSSWKYSKKKPYNLKLPEKADLYDMGKAKKWVLLSNYLDHSMLRNKFTIEMSRDAGMEYVMDSVFVDLYADGSYRGTYQLIERVQIQKKRVNIHDLEEETEKINDRDLKEYPQKVVGAESADKYMENSYKYYDIPNNPADLTGGYLLELQQWNRYGHKVKSGFITSRGQAISIDGPEYASKEQVEYIRSFVQDMEDALYSDTGYNDKGKHYSDYIDVDSLATAYLVQEISMNVDAVNSSFFFWKDSDLTGDGKLHFGPSWDFDLSYGVFNSVFVSADGTKASSLKYNNLYAAILPINGYKESGRPTEGVSWIGQFNKQPGGAERVVKIYFERFEPFLTKWARGEDPYLMQVAKDMLPSAEMSNARWHTYGGREYCVFGSSSGTDFLDSVDIFRNYAEKRADWLRGYWEPLYAAGTFGYEVGDLDKDESVNAVDAADILIAAAAAGSGSNSRLSDGQRYAADVNDDGELNALDAALILQYAAYAGSGGELTFIEYLAQKV